MKQREATYNLIRLDTVDSTNNYAKTLDVSSPTVIVAEAQTAGRGRLGRSFVSPPGSGIYMSIVVPIHQGAFRGNKPSCNKPSCDMPSCDNLSCGEELAAGKQIPLSLVTPAAAVATCRAIERICHVSPQIKWINDIYLNDKKICGILTETRSEATTSVDGPVPQILIIGIGVNCFPGSFPPEVAEIAGCISDDINAFSKDDLAFEISKDVLSILLAPSDFCEPAFLREYRDRCFILGKQITVTSLVSDEKYNATAVDVDRDGALIVKRTYESGEPEVLRLVSGEVSLHLD